MNGNPDFGQAGLTNCEREPIHLAGAVQPHGALLVLRESDLAVLQGSVNLEAVVGVALADALGRPAGVLGGDFERRLTTLRDGADLREPVPFPAPSGRLAALATATRPCIVTPGVAAD